MKKFKKWFAEHINEITIYGGMAIVAISAGAVGYILGRTAEIDELSNSLPDIMVWHDRDMAEIRELIKALPDDAVIVSKGSV